MSIETQYKPNFWVYTQSCIESMPVLPLSSEFKIRRFFPDLKLLRVTKVNERSRPVDIMCYWICTIICILRIWWIIWARNRRIWEWTVGKLNNRITVSIQFKFFKNVILFPYSCIFFLWPICMWITRHISIIFLGNEIKNQKYMRTCDELILVPKFCWNEINKLLFYCIDVTIDLLGFVLLKLLTQG